MTFKTLRSWAIVIFIASTLIIGLIIWTLVQLFSNPELSQTTSIVFWLTVLLSAGLVIYLTLGLMITIRRKFTIEDNKVKLSGTLRNGELLISEIKGYRISDKGIVIESNNLLKKSVRISNYIEKKDEIIKYLSASYPDLDQQKIHAENTDIRQNGDFGSSEQQRIDKLKSAQKVAKTLNITAMIVAIGTYFIAPYHDKYSSLACIFIPLTALFFMKYYKGLIRIDERKDTAYPTIYAALFIPGVFLFLKNFRDLNVLDKTNVWIPSTITSIALIVALLMGNKEFIFNSWKEYAKVFGFYISMLLYSYGTIASLNCLFDKSDGETYVASIYEMEISTGKNYIYLSPWGPLTEINKISVSKAMYQKLNSNEQVKVLLMKGKLGIPWYKIAE
ncbi:MAG: hypothetical protein GC181_14015 [Bacteroidetes bacterium]|nr:hypothetical protein [Bacteroidota bacterium]